MMRANGANLYTLFVLDLYCQTLISLISLILLICRFSKLRVINTAEGFKSTPRNQPFQSVASPSGHKPRSLCAHTANSCSTTCPCAARF